MKNKIMGNDDLGNQFEVSFANGQRTEYYNKRISREKTLTTGSKRIVNDYDAVTNYYE